MNEARVRQCLLAIAALNHGLMIAAEGDESLHNITDKLTGLLLEGGNVLEAESRRYPVRLVAVGELETQEMLPASTDERAVS